MASSCQQRQRPQHQFNRGNQNKNPRVQQVETQEAPATSPTRGGGSPLSSSNGFLYLTTLTIACCLVTPATCRLTSDLPAQILATSFALPAIRVSALQPMICPTTSPGQLFTLPAVMNCDKAADNFEGQPSKATFDLYRRNIIKYEVAGWHCRGMVQTIKLLTYFFGDEHLEKRSTKELMVTANECRDMVSTRRSKAGTLEKQTSGALITTNRLIYKTPSWGLPECCKWHEYTATNYFAIPVKIYKQHDSNGFQCTGTDVTTCPNYFANECQVGQTALVWEANMEAKCKYIFYKTLSGRTLQKSWISDDGQLALTYTENHTEKDCGKKFHISDQSILFIIRYSENGPNRGDISRARRQTDVGVVTSDELAAELQALYYRLREEQQYSYRHLLKTTCESLQTNAALLRTVAVTRPTEAVRAILNNSLLYSRSGDSMIEVWGCFPILKDAYQLLAQPKDCTVEIPIQFEYRNHTAKGYMNPSTLVVSHFGTPADCSLASSVPVRIKGEVHIYTRENGLLSSIGEIPTLHMFNPQWTSYHDDLMKPMIFRPVSMYSWQELQPSDELNAFLHTAGAQAEALALLGVQSDQEFSDADMAADNLAAGITSRGMTSLLLVLRNPFHAWVFIICAITTLYLFYKLFSKQLNQLKTKVMMIKSTVRNRWANPRRRSPPIESVDAERRSLASLEDVAEEPIQEVVDRSLRTAKVKHIRKVHGVDPCITILAAVNGKVGRFLFDSGSAISLISEQMIKSLGVAYQPLTCLPAVSVTGEHLRLIGEAELQLKIGGLEIRQLFRIFPGCCQDGILGFDSITKWGPIMLDPAARKIKVGRHYVPLEHSRTPPLQFTATTKTVIPPRTMAIVFGKTSIPIKPGQPIVFEQDEEKYHMFMSPRTLIEAGKSMPVRIINPACHPVTIYKDQKLGTVEAARKVHMKEDSDYNTHGNNEQLRGLTFSDSELTYEEQDELMVLLKRYSHLFAKSESELPGTDAVEHAIQLTDKRPIKMKAYRVPNSLRAPLDEKLDELLQAKIITPSNSPYASPLVIVKKPDGSIRPCVDFRKLNAVTVSDSYPLPRVDESMEFLSGAKYLTTLDLFAGFMQVPMERESQKYTAFITSRGLFEFKYMCFGLKNAPATFSRLMQYVLSGLLFHSSMIYMDDMSVASKTWNEHLLHLEEVFRRLDYHNLRLKMKKCTFARRELPFLGYLITTEGVVPDPANVKKLAEFQPPTTVMATRSFLGFVNYYRRFCPGFSTIARPLNNLTKKENKFNWTLECQNAFETLKKMVTNSPLLIYPKFDRPFIISCDASNQGCGAILSQMVEGKDRPIAYFSRRFTGAETRYEVVEKELYAVILSLKHWKHYIYGHEVLVYSDQKSLSWGIKQCDSPRMMRWIQQIAEFTVKIFYREGSKQGPADFLSRMYSAPSSTLIHDSQVSTPINATYELGLGTGPSYFLKEQKKDPRLAKIMSYLQGDSKMIDAATKRLAESYTILQDGVLAISPDVSSIGARYIVPDHLKGRILEEMHDCTWGSHMGVTRTYEKINQRFYWEKMRADVENWVASCQGCATRKMPTHPISAEMQLAHATAPWQIVCMDLMGPLPKSARGNQWILCIMDKFTKWPECVALRSATATVVARAFVSLVVTRHGVPLTVQSDRGRQFTSHLFAEVSRILGMKQQLSCAYRPQSQGLVERWNRTMAEMLRQYVRTNQSDWCSYLDLVLLAYRTSVHSSTGYTPFELQHGRQARLPTHLLVPENTKTFESEHEFAADIQKRLRTAYDVAREFNWQATLKQKKYHDRLTNPSNLEVGEQVYLLRPDPQVGLSPKLQPKFKGPFQLNVVLGVNGLVGPVPPGRGKSTWVHLNHLKRVTPRSVPEHDWESPLEDIPVHERRDGETEMARPSDKAIGASTEEEGNMNDAPLDDETSVERDEEDEEDSAQKRYNLRSRGPK